MTAPLQWSPDNPFINAPQGESPDTFSDDNPFVSKAPTATVDSLLPSTAAVTEPTQSDFRAGLVGAVKGGVPKSFGNFLKIVGLEELGESLINAGAAGEQAAQAYGAKAPSWRDVNSISEAIDFAQYQVGQGIGSTLPSLGAGAAGFAVGGPVGAAVGAIAASYMQNTGDIKGELDQLSKEDHDALALALGVPVALLDAVTPVDLINRIVAKKVAKEASRGMLKQAARSAASEGITESAQEAIQHAGTRLGTDQPVSLVEMLERGFEGGLGGFLTGGLLGAGAGIVGTRGQPPKPPVAKDPVTLKPPTDPTQEPSADEKAKREREIAEAVAKQNEAAKAKSDAKSAFFRAVNAWGALNPEQRKAVVPGLAIDQYGLKWVDLTKEAKAAVRTALGASDTNLYTSQPTVPSAPAAQGVGQPPAGEEPTASVEAIPAGPPASEIQADVASMSMQQIEDERRKAMSKLTQLAIDAEHGPATAEGNRVEREFWQNYLNDLEARRAEILAPTRDKQRASIEKITQEGEVVDIGEPLVEPTTPQLPSLPDGDPMVMNHNDPGYISTLKIMKYAKAKVGEVELRRRAKELARDNTTMGQAMAMEEVARRIVRDDKQGPDAGAQPVLPSGGPAPQAPTGPGAPTLEGGPTPGPEGPIPSLESIWESSSPEDRTYAVTKVHANKKWSELRKDQQQAFANFVKRRDQEPPSPRGEVSPQDYPVDETASAPGPTPEDIASEFPEQRIDKIEQSIEDLTQVEKLLNQPPASTLDLIYRNKIASLDLNGLDDMIDKAEAAFEAGEITEADFRTVLHDIADAKKSIKAREAAPPPPPLKIKMPDITGKDLNKTDENQRGAAKKSLASMLQQFVKGTPEHTAIWTELNRILDFEGDLREKNKNTIKGFLEEEKGEFRFGGWKLPSFRRHAVQKAVQSGLPHYEQALAKQIGLEEDPVNPYTVSDHMRRLYTRIFRHGAPIGSAERLSGKKLQPHQSPYIMAQMTNRFLTQAEEMMRGQGPFIPDDNGNFIPTGTPALNRISAMVGDDIERLGWLALARRQIFDRPIGLDPIASQLMHVNTPKAYHDAADALAQYNHDLAAYAAWGELITQETLAKFDSLFYAPIRRIFGTEIEGAKPTTVTPRGEGAQSIGGEQPIKRYRGSTRRMVNPFETSVDLTARIIRAANQNKVAALLVRLAKEAPDAYRGVLEPASAAVRNKIRADLKAKAEKAKAEAAEDGVELTLSEAERFVGTMGDEALAIRDNVLNVWVDGKLEHWVMHPELAYGMKSLTPHELGMLAKAAGVPAQVQRFTIVNDPMFIMTMSMVDTFQAFVNSRYGFVPVLDSFKGWWASVNSTPEYAEYRRGGGGLSSLTSKQYSRSKTSLHDIVGATSDQTPVAQAIQQLRTYHPIEAWRTLTAPIAEAARVGEYLNARGRGASVVEAVFAAKSITGNYSQQGGAMHALNHMTVFLNPALQVLDTTARVIGRNPTQWFLRSSILSGAAMLLYMANADDDEIRELRQTPGGQRYFFIRLPTGNIAKIRKPFFEGAVFASGVEAAMDKMRGENPEAFSLWARAILQEVAVHQLPTIGVIPAQYWANKDYLTGAPIVPEQDATLSPMFQARASTGTATRIIGKATNTSPVVLEWLARSQFGYLGSNVIAALDGAIDWIQSGEWPIAEELPFVNRVLARYPTSNVASIRNFYDRAKDVERAAADLEYAAMHEPEMLEVLVEKYEKEIALIDTYKDTRSELAEFRKAIEDLSTAPADVVSPSDKRQFNDEFLRIMIERAKAANLIHNAITEAANAASVPNTNAAAK